MRFMRSLRIKIHFWSWIDQFPNHLKSGCLIKVVSALKARKVSNCKRLILALRKNIYCWHIICMFCFSWRLLDQNYNKNPFICWVAFQPQLISNYLYHSIFCQEKNFPTHVFCIRIILFFRGSRFLKFWHFEPYIVLK